MKRWIPFLLAIVMLLSLTACGGKEESGFSEQTRQAVSDFVAMYGKDSPDYRGNAYVVSDFDNTTSVFDITYQSVVCQIERMAFAMDAAAMETALSANLDLNADQNADWVADIVTAYSHLWDAYGPFTAAGLDAETMKTVQADPWWQEFAAKLRAFLYHVEDTTPEEINYAWVLYWFSGMTPNEVYDLFYRSCILADSRCNGGDTHRTATEFIDDGQQDAVVYLIQSELIDIQCRQGYLRNLRIDASTALYLREVTNTT